MMYGLYSENSGYGEYYLVSAKSKEDAIKYFINNFKKLNEEHGIFYYWKDDIEYLENNPVIIEYPEGEVFNGENS